MGLFPVALLARTAAWYQPFHFCRPSALGALLWGRGLSGCRLDLGLGTLTLTLIWGVPAGCLDLFAGGTSGAGRSSSRVAPLPWPVSGRSHRHPLIKGMLLGKEFHDFLESYVGGDFLFFAMVSSAGALARPRRQRDLPDCDADLGGCLGSCRIPIALGCCCSRSSRMAMGSARRRCHCPRARCPCCLASPPRRKCSGPAAS